MKNNKLISLLLLAFILVFAACSSDDDSNPAEPQTPETVGEYSGSNSMDTTMTITVSNIGGTAYVTGYSINYKNAEGTIKGNYGETDSDGLAVVTSNSFTYALGSQPDEILVGTITDNTMTGSFKFPSNPFTAAISGTFTITKK